jgi:hypothetical protein
MVRKGMRGADQQQNHMFSYLSPEARVRKDHPLRATTQYRCASIFFGPICGQSKAKPNRSKTCPSIRLIPPWQNGESRLPQIRAQLFYRLKLNRLYPGFFGRLHIILPIIYKQRILWPDAHAANTFAKYGRVRFD